MERSGIVDTNDPNLVIMLDERGREGKHEEVYLLLLKRMVPNFLEKYQPMFYKEKCYCLHLHDN